LCERLSRVAKPLCGGDVEAGSMVDKQWLLAPGCKHFMALLVTDKMQARIEYMLKNGTPLSSFLIKGNAQVMRGQHRI